MLIIGTDWTAANWKFAIESRLQCLLFAIVLYQVKQFETRADRTRTVLYSNFV